MTLTVITVRTKTKASDRRGEKVEVEATLSMTVKVRTKPVTVVDRLVEADPEVEVDLDT